MKKLKQRLNNTDIFKGTFLSLGSAVVSEIISKSGLEFAILDLEHGVGNENDILGQLQAFENGKAAAIVRVESNNHERVHRVLDMGVEGIMFPRIKTLEEVQNAIKALRYAPEGFRGVAKMVRATNYGINWDEYYANQKNDIIGIIQVETEEILQIIDKVANIEGVDILFVGPMDLSMSLGVFGQFDHPKFTEAIKNTAKAAKQSGKICGILLTNPEQLSYYYKLGYRFFTLGADIAFINQGLQNTIAELNKVIQSINNAN